MLNRPLETITGVVGLRPKFSGAISFQDVTFTYAGTKTPALDRVSFKVPAGTMLGVVGRSGSGKSTITRLLQGINRDYKGFVKIDGADLRDIDLRHLRQSLGVVLQENFLFRGSIRDNIIAGRPGLSLTDAVRAARLAGAEEFIEQMPKGYETYIEEGSPNVSGGQRQRLAIARALICDPRILILDEATSALDPESEAVVTANLLRIAKGRTMIIVSHRLSSLVECDQILVLDEGKVMDIGPACRARRALPHLSPALGPAEPPSRQHPAGRRAAARLRRRRGIMTRTTANALTLPGRRAEIKDPTLPAILEFQWPSTAIVNAPVPRSARGIVWIVASMVLAIVAAMAVIPVDQVVTARGIVVSQSPTILVQPLETAIVRSIEVREGQVVQAGELLARLDPTFASADLATLQTQVQSLEAEVARLEPRPTARISLIPAAIRVGHCRPPFSATARPSSTPRSRTTTSASTSSRRQSRAPVPMPPATANASASRRASRTCASSSRRCRSAAS